LLQRGNSILWGDEDPNRSGRARQTDLGANSVRCHQREPQTRSPLARPWPLLLELQLALLAVASCRADAASVLWAGVAKTIAIRMAEIPGLARLDPLPKSGAAVETDRDRGN
jgi:hypothetical protein